MSLNRPPAPESSSRRPLSRAKFLLESLTDLRARLREAGSDLLIARGKPEEVLPAVAKSVGASAIYAHADVRSFASLACPLTPSLRLLCPVVFLPVVSAPAVDPSSFGLVAAISWRDGLSPLLFPVLDSLRYTAAAAACRMQVTEEDCLAERNVRSAAEAAGAPLKLFWRALSAYCSLLTPNHTTHPLLSLASQQISLTQRVTQQRWPQGEHPLPPGRPPLRGAGHADELRPVPGEGTHATPARGTANSIELGRWLVPPWVLVLSVLLYFLAMRGWVSPL